MSAQLRLVVAYEGTRYHGWQVQPDLPTIQSALEDAFFRMTTMRTRISAAGRTDAGVHARGQVVCLSNQSRHGPAAVKKGLNALLPEDIVVLEAEEAPADFDPRRQALGKHYRYLIHNLEERPVFDRHFRWHLRGELSLDAMGEAVRCLEGQHDFSAFRASGCEAKSPVRRIDRIAWSLSSPVLSLDVWGNGFLKQMVRNIVGTCVEVGRGRLMPVQMESILQSRQRIQAGPTAPACGLVMCRVYYEEEAYRRGCYVQ